MSATSLRIYLHIDSDKQAEETAEAIGDVLLERGFNRGEDLTAVVACRADADDVQAWADGPEEFMKAMEGAAFLLIPSEDAEVLSTAP